VAIITTTGCVGNSPHNDKFTTEKNASIMITLNNSSIVDYGNGVYFFSERDAEFGNALSKFIADHPELELVSFSPNDAYPYGVITGYWVVFRLS